MIKRSYLLLFTCLLSSVVFGQTDTLKQVYRSGGINTKDTILVNGGRAITAGFDITKNGKKEVLVASYNNKNAFLYEVTANDTMELIYTFPAPKSSTFSTEPRDVQVGDLDGDGNLEVFIPVGRQTIDSSRGYNVFEWNPTSKTFDGPYILLPDPAMIRFRPENFLITDIDKDGIDELIDFGFGFATDDDCIRILSLSGAYDGFYNLVEEFKLNTSVLTNGLAFAAVTGIVADADGNGKNELWVFGNNVVGTNTIVMNVQCNGPDSYTALDTTKMVIMTATNDYPLKSVAKADYNKDGKDEIYFPFFGRDIIYGIVNVTNAANFSASNIVQIYQYDTVAANATTNPLHATLRSPFSLRSSGRNNSPIYVAGYYTIDELSYTGGAVDNPSSYNMRMLWKADSLEYRIGAGFSGGFWYSGNTPGSDLDGDNKPEIVVSFQGIGDSLTKKYPDHRPLRMFEFAKSVLGVHDWTIITPENYELRQNYPNPFNPTTNISFVLPLDKEVTLKVYDMLGKEVTTLVNNEDLRKGTHTVSWNGRNSNGRSVASGTYIARLTTGSATKEIKMMLLK